MKPFCYFIIAIWFVAMVMAYTVEELDEKQVMEYTNEKHWSQPGCILYHNNDSSLNRQFNRGISRLRKQKKDIFFFTYYSKIEQVVKCYNKQIDPYVFNFEKKKTKLISWLKQVFKSDNTFEIFEETDNINSLALASETFLILYFPGALDFDGMKKMLQKVESLELMTTNLSVYFVPPHTKHERTLVERFRIEHFPTVLLYHRPSPQQNFEVIKRFEGRYEATEESIKLTLLAHQMKKISLKPETLRIQTTNKHQLNKPNLITVYSSSNSKRSYPYLHAFYRAYTAFTSRRHPPASLFILDLSLTENSIALPKHLQSHHIESVPFTFCVYKNSTIENGGINQTVLPEGFIPTYHAIEVFLQKFFPGVKVKNENAFPYLSIEVCHVNSTRFCFDVDEDLIKEEEVLNHKQKARKHKRSQRKQVLQDINDSTWDRKIVGYNRQDSWYNEASRFNVKNDLVIFISADCSYCHIVNKEFQQVAKASSFLDEVSVYLMNCTRSPIKCQEYHVTGYPTLLLFRTIKSDRSKECLKSEILGQPSWIDYHGNIETSDIMTWLAGVTNPSMMIAEIDEDVDMNKDVRLLVHFYTKDYVMRYLPRSLRGTLLQLSCLSKLCELLRSRMKCMSVPYQGVLTSAKSVDERDLFVAAVELHRSDGKKMLLMKVGKPMDELFKLEEISSSKNPNLHRPHTYDIPVGFVCEDSHEHCVDIIRMFILDHSRLPIIHLTEEMFHTHQRNTNELWNRPILLTLAQSIDLNETSSFYQQLYDLSVEFYRDINVAVLDVQKHSHWSKLFIPRDVNKETYDKIYNQYPRFCFIHMDDHSHAAFYPRVNESNKVPILIDFKDLTLFVMNYLKDSKPFLVETEHF